MKVLGVVISLFFSLHVFASDRCVEQVTTDYNSRNSGSSVLVSNYGVLPKDGCRAALTKKVLPVTPVATVLPVVKESPVPVAAQSEKFQKGSSEARLFELLNGPSKVLSNEKGTWVDFDGVNFPSGSATPNPSANAQLKNIAEVMKSFPGAQFKVGGYADNTGNPIFNKKLSQARAETILSALKANGVPAQQLIGAEGYGSEQPIADNATVEGRAKNRRMSLRVKAK